MMVSDTATLIRSVFLVLGVLVSGFHLSPIDVSESSGANFISARSIYPMDNVPSSSIEDTTSTRRVFVTTRKMKKIIYPEEKTLFANSSADFIHVGREQELNTCTKSVCYDESIGCFEPWVLSLAYGILYYSVCPEEPHIMGTAFYVFYKKNPHQASDSSRISPKHNIAFFVHGYGNTYNDTRMLSMKDKLLNVVDVVVMVDYYRGGKPGIPSRTGLDDFFQAAANVQVVGRQIANYINDLKEMNHVDPRTIHLIGYSLGSHAIHFAAEHAKGKGIKFGRITGLDPPGVLLFASGKRLFKEDANYVDVIHTTEFRDYSWTDYYYARSGKVGLPLDIGHADFYPNGAKKEQPGCEGIPWCSHNYALDLFRESIQGCKFPTVRCQSWDHYKNGHCHLGRSDTVRMGYWAQKDQAYGRFFPNTKNFVNGRC